MSRDVDWWIRADGRAYGPYPASRLDGFVREGRLGPSTPVAQVAQGPFAPAAAEPGLLHLFATKAEPPPATRPASPPAPSIAAPIAAAPAAAAATTTPQAAGPDRTLLVSADLGQTGAHAFNLALSEHGPSVRVGSGLWLVRTAHTPAQLRNVLSRGLQSGDRLLVVEAALADAAWFNVDGEADLALRRLWGAAGS